MKSLNKKAIIGNYKLFNFSIQIDFFEPEVKKPVPLQKVKLLFKIPMSLKDAAVSFQIENEAVFYPLFDSINLNFFETLLDRITRDKDKSSKSLLLHTNFESTRILTLTGDNLKLYTVEEEESILTNNNSDFFKYMFDFNDFDTDDIERAIRGLWKALNVENKEKIIFDDFKYVINILTNLVL
jgi:hypothetical protein